MSCEAFIGSIMAATVLAAVVCLACEVVLDYGCVVFLIDV